MQHIDVAVRVEIHGVHGTRTSGCVGQVYPGRKRDCGNEQSGGVAGCGAERRKSTPPPPMSAHPAPRYKSKHDSSSSSNTTTKKTSERARVRGRAPYLAALGLTQLLVAKPKRTPLLLQLRQPPSGRGAPVFSPEGGASGRAYGQQHAT
jgi:hypothetical protein